MICWQFGKTKGSKNIYNTVNNLRHPNSTVTFSNFWDISSGLECKN